MNELEKLQGVWLFTSLQIEGADVPPQALTGARIVIEGDRFISISSDATYEGKLSCDASARPCAVDIAFTAGPEAGRTSHGIYELEGDVWKLCLGLAGRERPRDFVTAPGSGHALETLRRVTDGR